MRKWILLFFLFCYNLSFSQVPKSKDSLVVFLSKKSKDTTYIVALNEYAFIMVQEGKIDEARKIILQMDTLSKKFNFGPGFCKVKNMYGVIEYSNQNPEKAMEYFLEARKLILKYKLPKKFYQNSLNNISIIYDQMGDRKNATKYAVELINYQEKNNLKPFKTSPYYQLGSNLKFYKKYQEALKYFNEGLALEKEYKNLTGIAIAENNIGNLYDDLQNVKEAIKHYESGLKSAEEANYLLLQTDFLINLGRMYRRQNNYIKAEKFFKKAEAVCIELEVTKPLKTAYQGLGDLYFSLKKYNLSELYYLKSLEIAKTIEDNESLYTVTESIADLYEAKKDFKKAFYYKTNASALKDSINKFDIAKNTEDLLRKYEAGKKEQEIKLLNIESRNKTSQLKEEKKTRMLLIAVTLFAFLSAGLIYWNYRNKQKINLILDKKNQELDTVNSQLKNANQTKAKLFSIISHDLRSPVSQLFTFLRIQQINPHQISEKDKSSYQKKLMESAAKLLDTMEDLLLWSKSQMEHFELDIEDVDIHQLFDGVIALIQNQADAKNLRIEVGNLAIDKVRSDQNLLIIVLRNLMQNAITHSYDETSILLNAGIYEGDKPFISIANKGNVISKEKIDELLSNHNVKSSTSGYGLVIVKEMLQKLNGDLRIESSLEQTELTICFAS